MDQDDLAQTILDLEKGRVERLEDLQLSYQLAHHVKPLIDRMSSDKVTAEFDIKALGAQAELASFQDRPNRPRRAIKKSIPFDGSTPDLKTLSVEDKARWILMERFISLEQHENILGLKFTENERETYLQELN